MLLPLHTSRYNRTIGTYFNLLIHIKLFILKMGIQREMDTYVFKLKKGNLLQFNENTIPPNRVMFVVGFYGLNSWLEWFAHIYN